MNRRSAIPFALALLALLAMLASRPGITSAIESPDSISDPARTIVLRTVEDPGVAPLTAAECPFTANVFLGAHTWSIATRASDGTVVEERIHRTGTARACALVTSIAEGATAPFFIEFDLADGVYAANGVCRVTSNNVPQFPLVLAGCALKLTSFPTGVAGGVAASASIFNPANLPGFGTGSFWTLRIYSSP